MNMTAVEAAKLSNVIMSRGIDDDREPIVLVKREFEWFHGDRQVKLADFVGMPFYPLREPSGAVRRFDTKAKISFLDAVNSGLPFCRYRDIFRVDQKNERLYRWCRDKRKWLFAKEVYDDLASSDLFLVENPERHYFLYLPDWAVCRVNIGGMRIDCVKTPKDELLVRSNGELLGVADDNVTVESVYDPTTDEWKPV